MNSTNDNLYCKKFLTQIENAETEEDKLYIIDRVYSEGFQDGQDEGNREDK